MSTLLDVPEGMQTPMKEFKAPTDTEKREAGDSQPCCSGVPFGKFSLGPTIGSRRHLSKERKEERCPATAVFPLGGHLPGSPPGKTLLKSCLKVAGFANNIPGNWGSVGSPPSLSIFLQNR